MQEKILNLLRKRQDYLSGQELGDRLKITRQALWKHIQGLKEQGFEIEAVPHLGYKLESSPDKLLPVEVDYNLNTKFIGRKIFYYESISSTMDKAMELGLRGSSEGTLILAEAQAKGKGRLGREWSSPKYKGIYLSLLIRPDILPNQTPIFTLLTAVAVCEAIKEALNLDLQIKWPNDLLINNKKVGGILTELNAEMDKVGFIVVGIGINVNNDKNSLVTHATSLKEHTKRVIKRIDLLKEVLRKIEKNYLIFQKSGSKAIIKKWRNYNVTLGKRVSVSSHHRHFEGEAIDIDKDGALLLRNDSGLTQRVTAGDITHRR